MNKLDQKIRLILRSLRQLKVSWDTLLVWLVCALSSRNVYASDISRSLCRVVNTVFDNELISIGAFVAFAGMLFVGMLGDGGLKEKSGLFKVGLMVSALMNLPYLIGLFTGRSSIC
jgi:hypothetical protein